VTGARPTHAPCNRASRRVALAHGGTFAHGERAAITLTLPCEAPV